MGAFRVLGAGFLGLVLFFAPSVACGDDEAPHGNEAEHGAEVGHGEEGNHGEESPAHHIRDFMNEVAVTYGF